MTETHAEDFKVDFNFLDFLQVATKMQPHGGAEDVTGTKAQIDQSYI